MFRIIRAAALAAVLLVPATVGGLGSASAQQMPIVGNLASLYNQAKLMEPALQQQWAAIRRLQHDILATPHPVFGNLGLTVTEEEHAAFMAIYEPATVAGKTYLGLIDQYNALAAQIENTAVFTAAGLPRFMTSVVL